jgi:hypothetical protein
MLASASGFDIVNFNEKLVSRTATHHGSAFSHDRPFGYPFAAMRGAYDCHGRRVPVSASTRGIVVNPARRLQQRQAREDDPVPLSQSPLWEAQRQYFVRAGVGAWRDNVVPSFATGNAFMAHTYAEILRGYLADLRRSGAPQPLQIIELGAGSGRFAHFLLRALLADDTAASAFRYVLTDVSRPNVDFWRAHPSFAPYFDRGLLDVALFDPAQDRSLRREISGSLGDGAPIAVIANYVFDSVEHDVFRLDGGVLQEGLVALTSKDGVPQADTDTLDAVALRYAFRPCRGNYYADPCWNAILQDYARSLPDGAFAMPVAPLRMLANLRELGSGPLLVLAADKAQTEPCEVGGREPPQPVRHGSVSFTTNFHALAACTRRQAGLAFLPGRAAPSVAVAAFCLGASAEHLAATARAYDAHVCRFGPDDFFVLRRQALRAVGQLSAAEILALLRQSRDDPATLTRCYERLVEILPIMTELERATLRERLIAAWEHYFPLAEDTDLAFCIGSLLAGSGFPADAARFFEISLVRYGDDPAARENLELCRRYTAGGVIQAEGVAPGESSAW